MFIYNHSPDVSLKMLEDVAFNAVKKNLVSEKNKKLASL